jgi:hypothetical protein
LVNADIEPPHRNSKLSFGHDIALIRARAREPECAFIDVARLRLSPEKCRALWDAASVASLSD